MQQNNSNQQSMFNIPPPLQMNPQTSHLVSQPPPPIIPPNDIEQRNIIEKLANFVSRNGVEFENVTKIKQKDNPRFNFLYGGEYYSYYQYRLNIERETFRQQQQQQQQPQAGQSQTMLDFSVPPPVAPQPDQINLIQSKINEIREQIQQSEKNLKAQFDVFEIKKKIQAEELIKAKRHETYLRLLRDSQLDINSLDQITNRIIESCTKEAIGAGRNFVFNKNLNSIQVETTCLYLLQRIFNKDLSDDGRLHLIYFINDIVHNGHRKDIDIIKKNVEKIIIPTFCSTINRTDEEKKSKMNKLLELWEKNKYFPASIIEKLKNSTQGMQFYEDSAQQEYSEIIKSLEHESEAQLKVYERQHKEFLDHSNMQLNNLEQQLYQLKKQTQTPPPVPSINVMVPPPSLLQQTPPPNLQQTFNPQLMFTNHPPPLMPTQIPQMNNANNNNNNNNNNKFNSTNSQSNKNPPALMSLMSINPFGPPQNSTQNQPQQMPAATPLMSIPPPTLIHTDPNVDLSRPPPGFGPLPAGSKPQEHSVPFADIEVPYYSLPAGLMLKNISLEDINYEPLDPKQIKLDPPEPPSEKLLKALEEFYSPASASKPRNADGWEKNGLYEFYKSKLKVYLQNKSEKESKKRQERKRKSSRRRARSSSRSRSRHRARRSRRSYSTSSRSSRRSSSSRSRSRTRSPVKQSSTRNISPVRQLRRRSPTPPSYAPFTSAASADQRIDSSNKGHQLLQKMGYSGGGLGRREQGIVNPIEGGEARDKVDLYKGIGMKSDPFEAFRKNKAQGYIQRLRDRDEERNLRKLHMSDEKN